MMYYQSYVVQFTDSDGNWLDDHSTGRFYHPDPDVALAMARDWAARLGADGNRKTRVLKRTEEVIE